MEEGHLTYEAMNNIDRTVSANVSTGRAVQYFSTFGKREIRRWVGRRVKLVGINLDEHSALRAEDAVFF